ISSSPWNAGPTSRSARRASTPRPDGAPISGYGAARGFVRHRHARHAPHPETGRPMNDVTPAPALTQREVLLHALYEAAELEHNLMCTYLYAAASLKDGEREGLGVEEAATVRRWRQVLLGVAIEEMGHLAAVWNITSGLGGSPRFGRTNFPLDPGYLPASVVVKLAPFNADTLQHFVFLERPHGSTEPEGGGFAYERSYVRGGTSGARLTPMGVNYETVGDFYAALGEGLRALVAHCGEANAFDGDRALQLSPEEVNLPGARPVVCLKTALAAFAAIVEQGEGAPRDSVGSHYQKFLGIRAELSALTEANPAFAPAFPAATNPVLRRPPRPEGRVWLENPDAVATVDLANACYGLMLRLLAYAYAARAPPAARPPGLAAGAAPAARAPEPAAGAVAGAGAAAASGGAPASMVSGGVETVQGERLELAFEARRCIHSRFCVTGAPQVFLANVKGPWLHPDAMPVERLVEVAHACPSGAIRYRRKDGAPEEPVPPVNLASVREGGPYAFRAQLQIDGAAAGFRRTLCRCRASEDKPYCDGSHREAGFSASGEPPSGKTDMLPARDGVLAIDPQANGPLRVRGNLEIMSGTGRAVARVTSTYLCRCGGSANKPFCDGTHTKIGVQAG